MQNIIVKLPYTLSLLGILLLCGPAACTKEMRPPPQMEVELVGVHFDNYMGWNSLSAAEDPLASHRPANVDCPIFPGYFNFEGMEIDSALCNYLSVAKASEWTLKKGDKLNILLRKDEFEPPAMPASAHFALTIGQDVVWDLQMPIPSAVEEYPKTVNIDKDYPLETPVIVHLHNHGVNTWTLYGINLTTP